MRKSSSYAIGFLLASLFILSALPAMADDKYSEITLTFTNKIDKRATAGAALLGNDNNNVPAKAVTMPPNGSGNIHLPARAPASRMMGGGSDDLYDYTLSVAVGYSPGQVYKDCEIKFSNDTDANIFNAEFVRCQFGDQATLQVQGTTLKATFIIN